MHASVTTFQLQPGKTDEAIRLWRESAAPLAMKQKGFKSGHFFTDRNTGKGIIVGRWETEADARAFESSGAFKEAAGKLASALASQPVREYYEVSEVSA